MSTAQTVTTKKSRAKQPVAEHAEAPIKRKIKKEPQPPVPAPTPAPVPTPVPVVVQADVPEEEHKEAKKSGRQKTFTELTNAVNNLVALFNADLESGKLGSNDKFVKKYQKEAARIQTKLQKLQKKPKAESAGETSRSGFSKPLQIAPEISQFAGWKVGELKSRNDVNKALCNYVRENGLQDQTDRRRIVPDAKLAKILRYDESEHGVLTFATMQKHFSHFFV